MRNPVEGRPLLGCLKCLDQKLQIHSVGPSHLCIDRGAVLQVLANPTADIQEGPKVGRAELKARGVRPYDEKVLPSKQPASEQMTYSI